MPNPTDQRIIELTKENAELKLIIQHLLRLAFRIPKK